MGTRWCLQKACNWRHVQPLASWLTRGLWVSGFGRCTHVSGWGTTENRGACTKTNKTEMEAEVKNKHCSNCCCVPLVKYESNFGSSTAKPKRNFFPWQNPQERGEQATVNVTKIIWKKLFYSYHDSDDIFKCKMKNPDLHTLTWHMNKKMLWIHGRNQDFQWLITAVYMQTSLLLHM